MNVKEVAVVEEMPVPFTLIVTEASPTPQDGETDTHDAASGGTWANQYPGACTVTVCDPEFEPPGPTWKLTEAGTILSVWALTTFSSAADRQIALRLGKCNMGNSLTLVCTCTGELPRLGW